MAVLQYPANFPCASWNYGEGTSNFPERTQFDSGWTRQRKTWPGDYTALSLTFKMSTSMLDQWEDWVTVNAYTNFFRISMDRFSTGLEEKVIRFTTPLSYSYDAYDVVIVRVDAEESRVLPNPDKIYNRYPESGLPVPGPGVCVVGEYHEDLTNQGLAWTNSSVPTSSVEVLNWPFADSDSGDPIPGGTGGELFFAYFLYVSAPNLGTSLGVAPAAGYTRGLPPSWEGFDNDAGLYCGGQVKECLNIKENGTNMVIKPQSKNAPAFDGGDHAFTAVISGFNGTGIINGSVVSNTGKVWNIVSPTKSWLGEQVSVGVSITSTSDGAGGYTQRLNVSVVGRDSSFSDFAELGYIGTAWHHISVAINSSTPYTAGFTPDGGNGIWHHRLPVSVSAFVSGPIGGGSVNVVTEAEINFSGFNAGAITSATLANNNFYNTPEYFRAASDVAVASMSGGLFDYTTMTAQQAAEYLDSLYG